MNGPRRAVVITYTLALALACLWIPWRAPIPREADESGTRLIPSSELRDLGYGWLWLGPSELRNGNAGEPPEILARQAAQDDTQGRYKANREAIELGRRPSAQEVERAVETARLERLARFESIRNYWHSNAYPNYGFIGLTVGALSAIAFGLIAMFSAAKRTQKRRP